MSERILTDKQAKVLAWIDRYMIDHGRRTPAYQDIVNAFGFSGKNAVVCHLDSLQKKGYITRPPKHTPQCRVLQIARRRDGDRVLIRGQWYRFIPLAELEASCQSVPIKTC